MPPAVAPIAAPLRAAEDRSGRDESPHTGYRQGPHRHQPSRDRAHRSTRSHAGRRALRRLGGIGVPHVARPRADLFTRLGLQRTVVHVADLFHVAAQHGNVRGEKSRVLQIRNGDAGLLFVLDDSKDGRF